MVDYKFKGAHTISKKFGRSRSGYPTTSRLSEPGTSQGVAKTHP